MIENQFGVPPLRYVVILSALMCVQFPVSAQDALPSGFAEMELERSRACVPVIRQLDELNTSLEPFVARSRRLIAIAQAVALEERAVVDSLDTSDPIEAEVRAWFLADGELAQRYVAEPSDEVMQGRAAARDAIKETVAVAIQAVQDQAQARVDSAEELVALGASCDGAIFVRSAVLEECEIEASPICAEAAEPVPNGRFRFVPTAEGLWDVEELRPWSQPGPLTVSPGGQLEGARTVGFGRNGNIVVTLAFAPLLRAREDLAPEEIAAFAAVNDSLGIVFDHPDIAFTPSLSLRASVPEPVAGESDYLLHFGVAEEAALIWTGPAGSGAPLEAEIALSVDHLARLASGEPISFTAIQTDEQGAAAPVYSVELSVLGQAPAVDVLLDYMAQQFSADLTRMVPPSGAPAR